MTQTTPTTTLDEAVETVQSAITLIGVELTRHGRADEAHNSRQAFETILSALKVRTEALEEIADEYRPPIADSASIPNSLAIDRQRLKKLARAALSQDPEDTQHG